MGSETEFTSSKSATLLYGEGVTREAILVIGQNTEFAISNGSKGYRRVVFTGEDSALHPTDQTIAKVNELEMPVYRRYARKLSFGEPQILGSGFGVHILPQIKDMSVEILIEGQSDFFTMHVPWENVDSALRVARAIRLGLY